MEKAEPVEAAMAQAQVGTEEELEEEMEEEDSEIECMDPFSQSHQP